MAHWRTLIEKDHLGAWDLVDPRDGKTPKDFTLQIKSVNSKLLKTRQTPKGKRKAVIVFERAKKAFVCNTTNCEIIGRLYGDDIDGWPGKLVTLYQGDVRNPNGGGTVKGICVRPKKPVGQAEAVPEREVDQDMRDEQNAAFGRGAEGEEQHG